MHTHTHMKTCRLTDQKNIDSQNRRLDVVGIRNPVKALDEWKMADALQDKVHTEKDVFETHK